MAKKQLPKKIFVCWNYDTNELFCWNYDTNELFLDSAEDPHLLAEKGKTVEVGLYELKEKVKLVNRTTIAHSG